MKTNQTDKIDQIDEIDEIDQTRQTNEMNRTNQMNQAGIQFRADTQHQLCIDVYLVEQPAGVRVAIG